MLYFLPVILISLSGYFLHRKLKVTPMSAFVITLCTGVLLVWGFGALGFLYVGGALFYAYCAVTFLLQTYFDIKKGVFFTHIKVYYNFANILFCVAAFLFLLIYTVQTPLLHYWDEYSFWGTASRHAYTAGYFSFVQNFGLNSFSGLPAGSTSLSFLFAIFGAQYNDYVQYFAYTVLTLACFALVAEFVCKKAKRPFTELSVFLFFVLSAFFQSYHLAENDYSSISYAFGTAMVDFLLAIYGVSIVVLYLSNKRAKAKYLYILPALAVSLTKDVGIIFAVLAICIIACFELFSRSNKKKMYARKICATAVSLILCLGLYLFSMQISTNYLKSTQPQSEVTVTLETLEHTQFLNQQSEDTANNTAEEQVLQEQSGFITSLFVPSTRTARHTEVLNDISLQFLISRTMFFVRDFVFVAFLLILSIVNIILASKKYRLALILASVGTVLGALLYIMSVSYFIAGFSDGMVEYPRYMMSYYWLWFYLSIALFFMNIIERHRQSAILLLNVILTVAILFIGLDKTVVSAPQNYYVDALNAKQSVEKYSDILQTSPRVLMIANKENDYFYNINRHRLLPAYINVDLNNTGIDFSAGFSEKEYLTDENAELFVYATDEEFLQLAYENFDYIYITYKQYEFVQSYEEHFKTPLKVDTLYRVAKDDNIYFEEVYAE